MKTLTAFYDLQYGPISFDVVTFLIRARIAQEDVDADRLHIVVVPYEAGLGGFSRHWGPHDEHAARWRLWNIVLPACQLAGATVTLAAHRRQADDMHEAAFSAGAPTWWPEGKAHLIGPIVDAARAGRRIPLLQASAYARRCVARAFGPRIVTLTLRHNADDGRDTNPEDWGLLAKAVGEAGFEPIVIRDTRDALEHGAGYAEFSVDLRLALYQRAALNLFGNNGPAVLAMFSSAPYIQFGAGMPRAQWEEHYRKHLSLDWGAQLPWADPNQVLVYDAGRRVMLEAFARWAARVDA